MSLRTPLLLVPLLWVGAAASAHADDVLLANGNKLEGKARRDGEFVVIETATGTMRLDAKDVKSITVAPTKEDVYREQLAKAAPKDAAGHVAMADWARDHGMPTFETKHLKAAIDSDPDHAAARARLGFIRYEDRWVTDEEYHLARGFVRVGGAWVSKDEILRRESERRAKEMAAAHVKRIQACIAKMSSPKRKVRMEGRVALQEYAETLGDPSLAQFATQVATYYNESWRAVKAESEGGTATVDVRATMTQLKRPIPTIETSLGGFSTPVRIQLPEMSVVSIRTTVRVPISIELDDDE
ncbi:MAG: hypothetical protein K8T90_04055 [Planctomycetes bacterium]|nr:hypothetical protein [Planctomycetota bacterium]